MCKRRELLIKAKKQRLDLLLIDIGLFSTIEEARAHIMSANVLVNEVPVDKVGTLVNIDSAIRLKTQATRYVSRGGEKLEGAIRHFDLNLKDIIALDVGASTGGFTDCLLQHGAKKVYAVDVGDNQIDYMLRINPQVVVMEKTHAKDLLPEFFDESPNFLTMDVSFISVRSMLGNILPLLSENYSGLILVKPQFELDREEIEIGGVVSDEKLQKKAVDLVAEEILRLGAKIIGYSTSVLKGAKKGNQEYFIYFSNN